MYFDLFFGQISLAIYNYLKTKFKLKIISSLNGDGVSKWTPLSHWLNQSSNHLMFIMMTAPRWNCHAIIGRTNLLDVSDHISIQVKDAFNAAKHWTIVVYDAQMKTIARIGSSDIKPDVNWQKIELEPGKYTLGIRYYTPKEKVYFPSVKGVDGIFIDKYDASNEINSYQSYLESIKGRAGFLYYMMHFHVYVFLKYQNRYEESWLKKRYLPVGNPDTKFEYGATRKGQLLNIAPSQIEGEETYLSVYNRASFPIYWEKIEKPKSIKIRSSGTYLIRKVGR